MGYGVKLLVEIKSICYS